MQTSEFKGKMNGQEVIISIDDETGHVVGVFLKLFPHNKKVLRIQMPQELMLELEIEHADKIAAVLKENSNDSYELHTRQESWVPRFV